MNSNEVCLQILHAESEGAVSDIIASIPELSDNTNWHPIDGRETNFNVVTNQASTGGKALTELCTNMVDAVLMKHAHEKGVSLIGPDAPQSVIAGVRDLVQLRGARSGILAEVDSPSYLQEFAEDNLVIGVTGGRRRNQSLCFTFVDNGEGQHPNDFEDTFLSLSKGNKSAIPFVQGKYNMGSSGVLSYCGRRWYKLIVSRRYDATGDWGWTLVRRRPGEGMPVAEYFKLDGRTPSFSALVLYPMNLQNGNRDDKVKIATGTVVKLYDYEMQSATSFRDIREALNENLVSTILPFRLMDYRVTPQRTGRREQGVDERPVNGMEFLLLRRDGDDNSDETPIYEPGTKQDIGIVDHPELGSISVQAIVLGHKLPGWLSPRRNNSRVFHAVNGQVQFKENRAYLSQTCKFPILKDRIIVIADASDLSEAAHNDVWKGDRESIRATRMGQLYKSEVTKVITDSQYLKDLAQRIRQEEMENLTEESQKTLLQGLVNNDPSIAQLLPGGSIVTLPGNIGRGGVDPEEYQGNYSPTFLNLIGRAVRQSGAEIAINSRRRVFFETDVVNDYFTRPDNRGRVFTIGLDNKFSYSSSLYNGRLTMNFEALPGKVVPGEEFSVTVGLLHDSIPEPVTEQITLRVVTERRTVPPGHRPPAPNDDDGEETTEARGLPPTKWLTRDGRPVGEDESDTWPDEFTDQDGGKVEDLGDDIKAYYINYDNAHFRRFLDGERDDLNRKVIVEQYRVGMLVLMMGLEYAYSQMEQSTTKEDIEENIDEIRRLVAQGAATVVMSIAKTLPDIINRATVEDPDD
jgi:hypothetical protein